MPMNYDVVKRHQNMLLRPTTEYVAGASHLIHGMQSLLWEFDMPI